MAAKLVEYLRRLGVRLQDGVHRDSVRQNQEIAAPRHRTEPGEMARQLSKDARKRGV